MKRAVTLLGDKGGSGKTLVMRVLRDLLRESVQQTVTPNGDLTQPTTPQQGGSK